MLKLASLVLGALLVLLAPAAVAAPAASPAPTAAPPQRLLPTPQFRHYGQDDGVPSGPLYSIAQDRQGTMWFGSAEGLVRFDGAAFTVLRRVADDPSSLPLDQVYALYVDRADLVWMGGISGGLAVYDPRSQRFRHWQHDDAKPHSLVDNEVWGIAQTADGALWVGTNGGLDRLRADREGFDHVALPPSADGKPGASIRALFADAAGRLWIGASSGLFVREADGRIRAVPVAPGFSGDLRKIWHIDGRNGEIRVSCLDGLLVIGADGVARPFHDEQIAGLKVSITGSARDAQGRLWLGSTKGALLDDGAAELQHIVSHPLLPGGLPDARIWQVLRDREGGLWFALGQAGIAYLPPHWNGFTRFTHIPDDPGSLAGIAALTVYSNGDGCVLVGGFDGWIDAVDVATGKVRHVSHALHGNINALTMDAKGRLWAAESGALYRIGRDGKATAIDLAKAGITRPVFLTAPGDGKLYLASWGEGFYAIDPDSLAITPVPLPEGLDGVAQFDQLHSHGGVPWLASGGGLLRLSTRSGRMEPVPGVPAAEVFALDFDRSGFWTATPQALTHYRYADGVATSDQVIDIRQQPFAANLMTIRADGQGNVWVFANPGLWRMDARTHGFERFGAAQGLQNTEFTNGSTVATPDGIIFAASRGGVIAFHPEALARRGKPVAHPLNVTRISVNRGGKLIELTPAADGAIHIGWNDHDLRVQARLASYVDPASNRYCFKLTGLDPGWVDVGSRGEREFAGLRAGDYTLHVDALDAAGAWSSLSQPLRIVVQAPPWLRWWAWLLYALTLVGAMALILWAWRRRLAQRHRFELIEQHRALAEDASVAKTRFLATLSHEIRTPMTGVMGMAELLLHTPLDTKQQGYTRAMQRSGGMLLKLLNDALDLVRIDAGRLALEPVPHDPRQLVHDVAQLEQGLAWSKRLRFDVVLADDLPAQVVGDAVRIKQVLLNLVGNALKFTEHGSVELRAARDGEQLVYSVTDTGPGIAEGSQARLFQRFEQEDTPQRRAGSGLGLAICRELVEVMGGGIELQSRLGHGCCFRVRLPLHEVAAPVAAAARPALSRALNLLLVEDDAIVATVIAGLLEGQGHRCSHTINGLLGLAELACGGYDALLLDLDLPGVDGFQVARLIRQREADGTRLPIIAVTARTGEADEAAAYAAGMDGFLRKPLTGEQLAAMLARVLDDAVAV